MEKSIILILFIIAYSLLLLLPKYRPYIALTTASIFIGIGIFNSDVINPLTLVRAIDLNVLMMISGTMVVVILFIESKAPSALADIIIDRAPTVKWAIIFLAFFAGLISAFIDNVATVLIIAPIAIDIAKRLKVSPVPMIVAISVSANLQGFATLVGDTTSIILGSTANMTFADFFWLQGRPGPFFVIQLGALATVFLMMILFRKHNQKIHLTEKAVVKDFVPSIFLIGIIVLLIAASFIPNKPKLTNGYVTVGMAIIAIGYDYFKHHSFGRIKKVINQVDFKTLFLLVGLFIVISTLGEVGIINDIASLFVSVGGNNPFVMFTLAVWISVLLSAFIDNIPYVATMLPVMTALAPTLGVNPLLLYFGLLAGATLGGNLTPIGASANIAGIGILKNEGHDVKFWDFGKIAIPMTLIAVSTAYILIWFLWS